MSLYSFTDELILSVKGTQTVGEIITDGISDETNSVGNSNFIAMFVGNKKKKTNGISDGHTDG
jgi:hypothetical protein